MSIRHISFIILSCFAFGIKAQNGKSIPGYLGARNAISFNVTPHVSINERLVDRLIKPYLGISLERAINRRSSVTVAIGQGDSYFEESDYYRFMEITSNELILSNNEEIYGFNGRLTYSNQYLSISKSYYFLGAGSIAPQGKYFKMGLNWNFYKIKKDNFEYLSYSSGKTYTNPETDFVRRTLGSFNMEFGSKRFIGKNLFIQKSIAFNTPLNFWSTDNGFEYRSINDFNETFIGYKLGYVQTLNFTLSLGYAFK